MSKKVPTPADELKKFKPRGWLIGGRYFTTDPDMVELGRKANALVEKLYWKEDDAPDTEAFNRRLRLPPELPAVQPVEVAIER